MKSFNWLRQIFKILFESSIIIIMDGSKTMFIPKVCKPSHCTHKDFRPIRLIVYVEKD